jgi:hypothetical protein
MLNAVMAAAFQDIGKTNDIAVNVGHRIFFRVAHTGLSSQIDNSLRFVRGKYSIDSSSITEFGSQMDIIWMINIPCQPIFLYHGIIVGIMIDFE